MRDSIVGETTAKLAGPDCTVKFKKRDSIAGLDSNNFIVSVGDYIGDSMDRTKSQRCPLAL
jgi:hypothetical protein